MRWSTVAAEEAGLVQGKSALRDQRLLLNERAPGENTSSSALLREISAWERLAGIWALDVLFAAAECNGHKS